MAVTSLLGLAKSPPIRPGHVLHSVVLYLAPGDYHRFHSPTEWTIMARRHIAGQLLSVSKLAIKLLPELYTANERVVLYGEWQFGFFSYVAGQWLPTRDSETYLHARVRESLWLVYSRA